VKQQEWASQEQTRFELHAIALCIAPVQIQNMPRVVGAETFWLGGIVPFPAE